MRKSATFDAARVAKMQHGRRHALTRSEPPGTVTFMKLTVTTDIALGVTDDRRFVTWSDVTLLDGAVRAGHARVALLHVGEVADDHGDVWRALRAADLEHLHDPFFDQGWYKDDFADGSGIDLLFVDQLVLDAHRRGRNLDLALVRRLTETLASGCQLVVMRYATALEAAHWAQLGFEISTPGRARGLVHLKLGHHHPAVVDVTGEGSFEVVGACTTGPLGRAAIRSGLQS